MTGKSVGSKITPESQLRSLIENFDPEDQKLIRSVRAAVRKRVPTANELVYDYGTSLVIGYSPTEHGVESVLSTMARSDGMRLYFMHGPQLPDPKKLLMGTGKQARYIPVEAAKDLAHPDVQALIVAAIGKAAISLPSERPGRLVIKSTAASKRRSSAV